ncbi:MAG: DUF2182 domain-containing protein [Rhodanobacteraceae bacterium]
MIAAAGTPLEALLRRDRLVVLGAIVVLSALAWAYLLWLAQAMPMDAMDSATAQRMSMSPRPWRVADFGFMFVMWVVMMVGMMTPSAAPMILIYARVGREANARGTPLAATGYFAAGYVVAWTGFSLLATVAQQLLARALMLSPMLASASNRFSGLVLIAAGLFQWTPLKHACLAHCQSPLMFIQNHGGFRREASASFALGLRHGLYCVGCCWALMALLFVGGVMNLLWIAALAVLVLLEKLLSRRSEMPRIAGVLLIIAGVLMLGIS